MLSVSSALASSTIDDAVHPVGDAAHDRLDVSAFVVRWQD
jgi:hypothetical protein